MMFNISKKLLLSTCASAFVMASLSLPVCAVIGLDDDGDAGVNRKGRKAKVVQDTVTSSVTQASAINNDNKQIQKLAKVAFAPVDGDDSVIKFTPSTWSQLQPLLDDLIQKTAGNPDCETKSFRFEVTREDWSSYDPWLMSIKKKFIHPVVFMSLVNEVKGQQVDGIYETYGVELRLNNFTRKQERARSFAYRFFGGKFDHSRINSNMFYDLMIQAGFTSEDFEVGVHGFREKMFVKPFTFQENTPASCTKELKDVVDKTLEKVSNKFVTFVFELPKTVNFNVDAIETFTLFNTVMCSTQKYLPISGTPQQWMNPIARGYETSERRLYLCFVNEKRDTLDLHELSKAEAHEKVRAFIEDKHANYKESCTVITGAGKHSIGGFSVIRRDFPQWMQSPDIGAFIESYESINQDSAYKIFLKKPVICDFSNLKKGDVPVNIMIDAVKRTMKQGFKNGDFRLFIKINGLDLSSAFGSLGMIKHKQTPYMDLLDFTQEILHGEMRVTLVSESYKGPSVISNTSALSTKQAEITIPQAQPKATAAPKKAQQKPPAKKAAPQVHPKPADAAKRAQEAAAKNRQKQLAANKAKKSSVAQKTATQTLILVAPTPPASQNVTATPPSQSTASPVENAIDRAIRLQKEEKLRNTAMGTEDAIDRAIRLQKEANLRNAAAASTKSTSTNSNAPQKDQSAAQKAQKAAEKNRQKQLAANKKKAAAAAAKKKTTAISATKATNSTTK